FRWADEPTRLLLATYKRHENLLHTGKLSVKKFWEMISNKLKERAYDVTGQQCKSKINRLKKTYKNVKDYNNKSGNNKRTWLYFEVYNFVYITQHTHTHTCARASTYTQNCTMCKCIAPYPSRTTIVSK
ncbi:Trihelix transcription factor GT-4, partial [Trachymyrmex cornetzi]